MILLQLTLLLLLLLLLGPISQVLAVGLGDQSIWSSGVMIADEMAPRQAGQLRAAFLDEDAASISSESSIHQAIKRTSSAGEPGELDEQVAGELLRQIKVDVVVPIRELAQIMNLASTKSNAKLLEDFEKNYKSTANKLSSINKPALMTYLALKSTRDEDLQAWSRPLLSRGRAQVKLIDGCKSILRKHQESIEAFKANNENNEQQYDEIIKQKFTSSSIDSIGQRRLALLVFNNNLNLFLLDSYGSLCSRVVGEHLADELERVNLLI